MTDTWAQSGVATGNPVSAGLGSAPAVCLPDPVTGHQTAYIVGGASSGAVPYSPWLTYDLENGAWGTWNAPLDSLSQPACLVGASATVLGSTIYVVGGHWTDSLGGTITTMAKVWKATLANVSGVTTAHWATIADPGISVGVPYPLAGGLNAVGHPTLFVQEPTTNAANSGIQSWVAYDTVSAAWTTATGFCPSGQPFTDLGGYNATAYATCVSAANLTPGHSGADSLIYEIWPDGQFVAYDPAADSWDQIAACTRASPNHFATLLRVDATTLAVLWVLSAPSPPATVPHDLTTFDISAGFWTNHTDSGYHLPLGLPYPTPAPPVEVSSWPVGTTLATFGGADSTVPEVMPLNHFVTRVVVGSAPLALPLVEASVVFTVGPAFAVVYATIVTLPTVEPVIAFTATVADLNVFVRVPLAPAELAFTAAPLALAVKRELILAAITLPFSAAVGTLNLAVPFLDFTTPVPYVDPDASHMDPISYPDGPPSGDIPNPPAGYGAVRRLRRGTDAQGRDTVTETVTITPLPVNPAGDIGVTHVTMPSTVTLVDGLPTDTSDVVLPFRPPFAYVLPPYTIWGALPIND